MTINELQRQMKSRKSKDLCTQILKDLIEFGIEKSLEEIRVIKEDSWKSLVKTKTTDIALKYLNSITGSKRRKYNKLRMSNYLCSQNEYVSVETAKFIAKIK